MYSAWFKTWNNFTAQNLAQWKKLNQTAFSVAGSLLQTQVELAAALTDVAAYHADNIVGAKDPSEIASRQFGLAEESGKILMETAHSTAEILTEAGKTYSKLFENTLASASAFTANTQKAQKSAA